MKKLLLLILLGICLFTNICFAKTYITEGNVNYSSSSYGTNSETIDAHVEVTPIEENDNFVLLKIDCSAKNLVNTSKAAIKIGLDETHDISAPIGISYFYIENTINFSELGICYVEEIKNYLY